jgi:hypothetical protein
MTIFTETFFRTLVLGAVIASSAGAALLVVLLVRDIARGDLW